MAEIIPNQLLPSENLVPENQKEAKLARYQELKEKYEQVYNRVKDQSFVVVYRAEGDTSIDFFANNPTGRSQSPSEVGSWYSESYQKVVVGFKAIVENQTGGPAHVYAVIIPQSLLDERDSIQKLSQEVNVFSPQIQAGKMRIGSKDDSPEPNLENFLSQLPFVKEYRQLEQELEKNRPPDTNTSSHPGEYEQTA